jgi:hypothetical protein
VSEIDGGRYKRLGARPISLGLNLSQNPTLLEDGQTPDALNVDFDRGSVRAAGGSIKFNNQTAPRPGVRFGRTFDALLASLPTKSAPARAYGYIPYQDNQDIGGIAQSSVVSSQRYWHQQRGQDFDLQVSFRVPDTEKLYPLETLGQLTTATSGVWDMKFTHNQALDEFFAVIQKGGDRFTPMSWALGVVNTGDLFDINVGGGNNIFGVATTLYATRPSNYALCFMWLDTSGAGHKRPVEMRYRLSAGSVWSDEGAHVASSDGAYSTMAYRAVVIPHFIVPGRDYHVSLALTLDTGSSGTSFNTGTGELSGVSWNDNGSLRCKVGEDYSTVQTYTYSQASPASATIYRYKGPTDSLEYLSKYGVRHQGKDAMFLGLGFRYQPWSMAGFVPFGIDAAPWEVGGQRLTDQTTFGPSTSAYADWLNLDLINVGTNTRSLTYTLKIAHDPAKDLTGTLFEVSDRRFVENTGFAGHVWGNESTRWATIAAQGKLPWSPYNVAWAGLGGLSGDGFNPQALKSYRIVFAPSSSVGFSSTGSVGGLLSIHEYSDADPYATPSYAQHFSVEGGSAFNGASASFGPGAAYTNNGDFYALIRAFRWNQREVVVSDVRIYERARTWSDIADFSLVHDLDPDDVNDPGFADLVGHWPLTDGGGTSFRDTVGGNTGYFEPMGTTVSARGEDEKSLFISGEGEALMLNIDDDPKLATAIKDLLRNPSTGVAVQVTLKIPEASYGLGMRQTKLGATVAGGDTNVWRGRFGPSLLTWDMATPTARAEELRRNPNSSALATTSANPVDGSWRRPPPLFEFGHCVEVDDTSATATDDAFRYPLGFSLRTPVRHEFGRTAGSAFDSNMAAWDSGTNRWSSTADWVGKRITLQIGFEPTGTDDQYKVYIAGYPKQYLNPVSGDPPDAEFAYFTSAGVIGRRDIPRTVITIGGAWRPTQADVDDGGVLSRRTITYDELNTRVILESVHVFAALPAGALPGSSGSAVTNGRGRITGGGAFPLTPLEQSDIVRQLRQMSVVKDRFYLNFPRGTVPPTGHPKDDTDSILYQLLVLGERREQITGLFDETLGHQEVFFSSNVVAPATVQERYRLILNRKVCYPSLGGMATRMTRHISYTCFADDVSERGLLVGNGQGFDPTNSTVEDARRTDTWFANIAGFNANWKFRVYSAFGSGDASRFWPRWMRGAKRSRANAIRGIHSINKRILVGAQGSVFEADDRWRPEGPTSTLTKSIAVRGKIDKNDLVHAEADDRISFAATNVDLKSNTLKVTSTLFDVVLDAWVKLDSVEGLRTIAWCGNESSDPAQNVGTHKFQWWTALNDGYPELRIGSTDTVSAAVLNRGVFIARSANSIPTGRWVHVRWIMWLDADDDLQPPALFIDGRPVSASITARGDGTTASGDWVDWGTIQSASGYKLYLGVAQDAVKMDFAPGTTAALTTSSIFRISPSYFLGRVHALGGQLAGVVVARVVPATSGFSRTAGFSPKAISYSGVSAVRFSVLQSSLGHYGVGHKCYDAGGDQWGTIYSHPFISINHEMGADDVPFSFADYGSETYVANGGRVGIIEGDDFRFAGVLPPQTLPQVSLNRPPLYKQNEFDASAGAIDHRPDNDPIIPYASTTTTGTTKSSASITGKAYHFYNNGGMYLSQSSDVTMRWTIDTFLCFKTYFRMDSVEGRINLFSRRDKLDAGYFVEIRDGYVYAGWYDPSLKKECTIRTSKPIIRPGYVYYLYYRKLFPRGGLISSHNALYTGNNSNWANSIFRTTGTLDDHTFDALIVREFPRSTLDTTKFQGWTGYDAIFFDKDAGTANYDYPTNDSSARACISFTHSDMDSLTVAPGLTTPSLTGLIIQDAAVSAASAGANILLNPAETFQFTLDHVGKLIRIRHAGASYAYHNRVFRIVDFISARSVTLRLDDDTAADFTGNAVPANTTLDCFIGTSLVKSENYDQSVNVDQNDYVIEMFGSSLQANPLNGITPFKGHAWSTAYKVVTATGSDASGNKVVTPQIFEDTATNLAANMIAASIEAGTDMFGIQGSNAPGDGTGLKDGTPAGELMCDATFAHSAWLTTAYFDPNYGAFVGNATAPNALTPNTLTVDQVSGITSTDPVWTYVSDVESGTRKLRITAYDPDNAVESLPSDEMEFVVNEDLETSPAGLPQIVLSRLPPTANRYRTIHLKVYCSAAGADTLFEIARIEDPYASSVVIDLDDLTLASGTPLPLGFQGELLGAPPRAKYVATSQGRMCYANLYAQADGVAYSLAFNPEIVPVTSIFPVDTGDAGITGIRDLFGALVVFKRTAIIPFIFDENGEAVAQRIILGDGCVSNASIAALGDRLYFVSDRGPKVMIDGWEPFHISRRIQAYFHDTAERSSLPLIQSTLNRKRAQYVFTIQGSSATEMRERFSVEFDHPGNGTDTLRAELQAGHRFSYYDGPAVTALGQAESYDGGLFSVIGGTPEGFLVWMDRDDTRTVLTGPLVEAAGVPLWGDRTLAWTTSLAGDIDSDLEGPMGLDLRWYISPTESRRKCLFRGSELYFSGPTQTAAAALTAAALPSGSTVSVGAQLHRWSTRHFDAGTPDLDKRLYYLDVTRTIEPSGQLTVDCYKNNTTTVDGQATILLTEAFSSEDIGHILQLARSFRFVFRTQTPQVDVDFELLDVLTRYKETDVK